MLKIHQFDKLPALQSDLKDKTLPLDLIDSKIEKGVSYEQYGATFSIAGNAKISAFNDVNDIDEDQVIGTMKGNDDTEPKLQPQIELSPEHAWLKYKVGVNTKASAGHDLTDEWKFNFKLDAGVSLSSYRIHSPKENLAKAAQKDFTNPKFIIKPDHILDLDVGEAVSLQARGKLEASLTLSWADVFAGQISLLSDLLDGSEAFSIKFGASAYVTVNLLIEDNYVLIFSRTEQDWLRVAVKKPNTKSMALSPGFSITAQFADPKAVEVVLNEVTEGLLGQPLAKIDKILNADSLDSTSKEIVDTLLDRLGLEDSSQLKEKLNEFKNQVAKRLNKMATLKASLSFSYEYKRLRSTQAILQARMRSSVLDRYHEQLIKGQLGDLMQQLRDGNVDMVLEKFLNIDTLKITQAWGFSLALGKWSAMGRDKSELTRIINIDSNGHKQVCFEGIRGYESKWGEENITWQTDIDVSMANYSGTTMPTANEFDYAFSITYETKGSAEDIETRIDHAIIWGTIGIEEKDRIKTRLSKTLQGASDINYKHVLIFNKYAFGALLGDLATGDTKAFGLALGAGMPWTERYADVRQNQILRKHYYGALWKVYLDNAHLKPSELAGYAKGTFRKAGFTYLAKREGDWRNSRTTTIAGIAELNSRLRQDWNEFMQGARTLVEARAQQKPYPVIEEAVKNMRRLGSQSHYVRSLGVYLIDLHRARPDIEGGVEKTFSVTYTKNRKEQCEIFSVS